jgi:LPXTG-site transpeptidase (sortase) family protein
MNKLPIPKIRLRSFNNCLTGIVAVLAVYIIAAPFLPQLTWWLRHDAPVRVLPQKTVTLEAPSTEPSSKPSLLDGDSLVIPRLGMQETIHQNGKRSLSKGVWKLPHTSTPDKGGNTVLVGHRFTYAGSAVFYHLDKIEKGDRIGVHWQGKLYEYKVFNTRIVTPDEVSVEADTDGSRLTLYTCTPLWSVTHRLVIQAELIGGKS